MRNANPARMIEVLLVEDNEGDIGLIREALAGTAVHVRLHVVMDGLKALEFVRAKSPRPHLVILDLNIPGKSGYDVLKEVKRDPDLEDLPVIIFTSSAASRDVQTAYKLRANSFVRKPADLDEFFAAVASMEQFWTQTASLPSA